ncbi:hypothetical protein ASPWEDRAFT_60989 [Aspergillus wentii DTO 134E9]|uniref:Uncharacterized protein n=1 Tax=Aspergillus wentii DTO 134E9 TaxID=1073089 RepID=A0A1L9RCU7_ASPWE|nr:uncharacterized protein ASPWEDRAFT_60989 [Aspergillus wentii DTO 134E9]OJJ32683.1 hypothetical protein ASPWEDRAFT_60989 [Aspergillus wentii DTO 134E9]
MSLHTASHLRLLATRPKVVITLEEQKGPSSAVYTTLDRVNGTAIICVDRDTLCDNIDITFEGTSETSLERATRLSGRRNTTHTFLTLRQPIEHDDHPGSLLLKAGKIYKYPFTFVVPEFLLPQACFHGRHWDCIEKEHTKLPPTFGSVDSGKVDSILRSLSSEPCQISYQIRVRVSKGSLRSTKAPRTLVDASKMVHVIPTSPGILDSKSDYDHLLQPELAGNGLDKHHLDRLSVTASQPKRVLIDSENDMERDKGTVTTIHLRYDPMESEDPPHLAKLSTSLNVLTNMKSLPWTGNVSLGCDEEHHYLSTEEIALSSFSLQSNEWAKHSPAGLVGKEIERVYYIASITVPVLLPRGKHFSQTFDSCLISRFYTLRLCLSVQSPKGRISTPTIAFELPVTVTST